MIFGRAGVGRSRCVRQALCRSVCWIGGHPLWFGQMQQQMFDQFQQAMVMMVQMFRSLHRDQMQLVREELDRLHELTAELQSLQADLAKNPPQELATSPPAQADSSAVQDLKSVRKAAEPAATGNRPHVAQPAAPGLHHAPAAAEQLSLPPPGGVADGDMHAWLSQRIAALSARAAKPLAKAPRPRARQIVGRSGSMRALALHGNQ